jgi:tRNA-dihydrouridine synthase
MSDTINNSLYNDAPEMLLNKLAEINDILAKQKSKTGETDSYKFWSNVAETMLFAWQYIQDFQFIDKKNRVLEHENKYLKFYIDEIEKRLIPYEAIRKMKLNGTFEENSKIVDELINAGNKEIRHPDNTTSNE